MEDVRLPMPEAEFVGRLIAADSRIQDGVEGREWPRIRVQAYDQDPMFAACCNHGRSLARAEIPGRPIRYPAIPMHRQRWRGDGCFLSAWVGQCPDCGTIHYAISEDDDR